MRWGQVMKNRVLPKTHTHKRKGGASLSGLRFYDGGFVLDVTTGLFFKVSQTAVFILRQIADGSSHDDLVVGMQNHYGVSRNVAIRDVELLTNELVILGILNRDSLKRWSWKIK